jgi:hypothetical protein
VVLCRIGTYGHHDIGVGNIIPVVGHGTASERFRQTGDSSGMSYTGVVFQVDDTQGSHHLREQVALFVV